MGLERLENLKKVQKDAAVAVKERETLLAEKQQLDKLRRKLTPENQAKLQKLECADRMHKLKPAYYADTTKYDDLSLDISKIMVIPRIIILLFVNLVAGKNFA